MKNALIFAAALGVGYVVLRATAVNAALVTQQRNANMPQGYFDSYWMNLKQRLGALF